MPLPACTRPAIWRGVRCYYIERDYYDPDVDWWVYEFGWPTCKLYREAADEPEEGPPPSETLRTLIAAGAPWYAVLDRFVEEYPQWEEVLAWAPAAAATEGV